MGTMVNSNPKLVVNAVDLSDHVRSATLTWQAQEVDNTTAGSTGYSSSLPGLLGWSLAVQFAQDYASAKVDATLSAIMAGGVAVAVSYVPVNTTVAATNPNYNGNAILTTYPQGGSVGALAETSVTFKGTGVLARTTTP